MAAAAPSPLFDRDVYAILRRAFKDPKLDILPLRVERSLQLAPAPAAPGVSMNSTGLSSKHGMSDPLTIAKPVLRRKLAPAGQMMIDFSGSD
jgi:hypothetical protein